MAQVGAVFDDRNHQIGWQRSPEQGLQRCPIAPPLGHQLLEYLLAVAARVLPPGLAVGHPMPPLIDRHPAALWQVIEQGGRAAPGQPHQPPRRFEDQEEANEVPEAPAPAPAPEGAKEGAFTWYTVRSGDSLYLIAKRHPGVSSEQLMKFNGIGADIRPGQRIKIPNTP